MDDIAKRFANLSPEKRALLERKLKSKGVDFGPTDLPGLEPSTTSIAQKIAGLSPVKRALLELRLRQKKIPQAEPGRQPQAADDVIKRATGLSAAKLALLKRRLEQGGGLPVETTGPTPPADDVAKQVSGLSPAKLALLKQRLKQRGALSGLAAAGAVTASQAVQALSSESTLGELNFDEEPEPPDWLVDPAKTLDMPEVEAYADGDQADDVAAIPAAIQSENQATPSPEAASSTWLDALRPSGDTPVDDRDLRPAEATGMLAGISTLLPAEKVSIPTTLTGDQPGGLDAAAQEFYSVATEAPQPAMLPAPLTRHDRLVSSIARAALSVGFIILLAIPLLLGARTISNNNLAPWSEPSGDSSEALDSQRRQLISEQLGIIDLQQPDSVALVSFDYSTATQGEMQPLARAILGRLRGQGMRIIALSLEPEGANIAQQTIELSLSEREQADQYGQEMINLGYLPGRVAAVRGLAADQTLLSTIPDFEEKQALEARPEWTDVQNLNQVDIVVTLADNPVSARWWIEQLGMVPPPEDDQRFILAATSASADPFLRPYRESEQLDGLVSGINGAAAIEAGRREFGPARQMIDSMAIATIVVIIVIAAGIVVGWMPSLTADHEDESGQPAEVNEHEQPTTQV
jgi:hypothetical protein